MFKLVTCNNPAMSKYKPEDETAGGAPAPKLKDGAGAAAAAAGGGAAAAAAEAPKMNG